MSDLSKLIANWNAPILVSPKHYVRVSELMKKRNAAETLWDDAPPEVQTYLLDLVQDIQSDLSALCSLREGVLA